jgi:(S)-ureidoglycine aminohydrolase
MTLFGSTRSRVRPDHALIAPDSFVKAPLPGWEQTDAVVLISPHMGARFTQFLAMMNAGAVAEPAQAGVERVVFVLDGEVTLHAAKSEHLLTTGGFAFLPADGSTRLKAKSPARLNVFEKIYVPLAGVAPPEMRFGQEQTVEGIPFLGDPDAVLKTFLPTGLAFDLAVNLFTFRPGAALPMVEVHVMEHGLLMVEGQGVYRLADEWYPVQKGDVIWMASYCPQWFVAMGKGPARYLYYKDVNRDPLKS